jgi:hypothetical protein
LLDQHLPPEDSVQIRTPLSLKICSLTIRSLNPCHWQDIPYPATKWWSSTY